MTRLPTTAVLCLVLALAAVPAAGQQPAPLNTANGEWPSYGGDAGHQHYSPLDQIDASNFGELDIAWRFKTDNLGPGPEFKLEGTPVMAGGVLYATGGTRRAVVALDAASGELLWVHSEHEGARAEEAPRLLSGRGLAYWTDGEDERILYVTLGFRLVARDVVIVGGTFADAPAPKTHNNTKGLVQAFDVRTGRRLWNFNTVPRPGEFGVETWLNDSWGINGNNGVWTQISADPELGIVYLPVETPSGDYYGGHRPGDNLFGESLVAVDLLTGERKWNHQLVHHPIWGFDMASPAILVDINVDGRPLKAVAQPGKQAFLYVFDRVSGEPVWPIEERPAPQGDVPGEWYSPTQPFPTQPPAYNRQGSSIDDLIDFTPELRAEAVELVSRYKLGPMFTPPVVSDPEGPIATLGLGAGSGGTNWPGGGTRRAAGLERARAAARQAALRPPVGGRLRPRLTTDPPAARHAPRNARLFTTAQIPRRTPRRPGAGCTVAPGARP